MAKRPMTPTPDRTGPEAARLRAAHELLDERPSPGVRATVLRAAAESARATAVDPVRVPRKGPTRWWLGWRPAAAAGATAAVGILAAGISVHVEQAREAIYAATPAPPPPPPAGSTSPAPAT